MEALLVNGSKTMGKSEVAEIEMASVIHHVATQTVVDNTPTPFSERPSNGINPQ